MKAKVSLNGIYKPSEEVVARDVHGEFIIIPITSGIGDSDEEIFSLNKFAKAIWDKLDGKRSLRVVTETLALEFAAPEAEIQNDVLGLLEELLKRRMLVAVKRA